MEMWERERRTVINNFTVNHGRKSVNVVVVIVLNEGHRQTLPLDMDQPILA